MGDLAERFPRYSRLLKLYPTAYRREYGEQMLQTLADMLDADESPSHQVTVWMRTALDLPLSAARQQFIFTGGVMAHETPDHIKLGSLAGAVLLLPFFIALVANGLNKVIYGQDLYHSWLWSTPVLFTWVILLPALAFIVGSVTFLAWSAGRRKQGATSSWKLLTDWHHNWPMIAVLLVSLGILGMVRFHDSVHCVAGNPVREIRNPSLTWRCIQDN